jgi:fructose-bisphosphate aldolase class II
MGIGETDIYTDPKQAKDFVDATAVDCLAVAFGTVHGGSIITSFYP